MAKGLVQPRNMAHQQQANQRIADLRRKGFHKKTILRQRIQAVDQTDTEMNMVSAEGCRL